MTLAIGRLYQSWQNKDKDITIQPDAKQQASQSRGPHVVHRDSCQSTPIALNGQADPGWNVLSGCDSRHVQASGTVAHDSSLADPFVHLTWPSAPSIVGSAPVSRQRGEQRKVSSGGHRFQFRNCWCELLPARPRTFDAATSPSLSPRPYSWVFVCFQYEFRGVRMCCSAHSLSP